MVHNAAAVLRVGFQTDKGLRRDSNQDSYAVLGRADLGGRLDGLFVVADGMGGMGGGDVASGIVAQTLPEALHRGLRQVDAASVTSPLETPQRESLLRDALAHANTSVWQHKSTHRDLSRMGTTCVAALVQSDCLTIANVGDSRAYLLREGRLRQITQDHSTVWQEVLAGRMTHEEARTARFRNVITRGIGLELDVTPDIETLSLRDGDSLLLCSDGLSTELPDRDIARLLAGVADPQVACDYLVQAALQNGGSDNITVVVVRVGQFVPTTQTAVDDEAPAALADEDDITDPNQTWREHLRHNEETYAHIRDDGDGDSTFIAPARSLPSLPYNAPAKAPLWPLLLVSAIALIQAIVVFLFWNGTLKPRPASPLPVPTPPAVTAKPTLPTDKPLTYDAPVPVATPPLQNGYLALEPSGSLLVVSREGAMLRVTAGGQVATLDKFTDFNPPNPSAPLADRRVNPPPVRTFALDASGNHYVTQWGKSPYIVKYDASDNLLMSNIGGGQLKAPHRIAVAPDGTLWVLDAHTLKHLDAHPSRK